MFDELPQTYITVKYKGKEKTMRRFGECNLLDSDGKIVRRLSPAEYLYEVKDGKKIDYRKEIHVAFKKKSI